MNMDWQNSQALSESPLAGNPTAAGTTIAVSRGIYPQEKLLSQQSRHTLTVWRLPFCHSPLHSLSCTPGNLVSESTCHLRSTNAPRTPCRSNAHMPLQVPTTFQEIQGEEAQSLGMSRMQKLTLKNTLEGILRRTE